MPRSNGRAEVSVKNMKKLLAKTNTIDSEDFQKSLLMFRNTPTADIGFSPAQLFFGRGMRTLLPQLDDNFKYFNVHSAVRSRQMHAEKKTEKLNVGKRELPPLHVGDEVYVQNTKTNLWDSRGIVKTAKSSGRSYEIDMESGRTYWRNRKYL